MRRRIQKPRRCRRHPAPGPHPQIFSSSLAHLPTYPVLFYIVVSICHPPLSLSTLCPVTREGLSSKCALIGCSSRVGGTTSCACLCALLGRLDQTQPLLRAYKSCVSMPTPSFELKSIASPHGHSLKSRLHPGEDGAGQIVLEPHLSLYECGSLFITPSAACSPRKLKTSTTKAANHLDIVTTMPLLSQACPRAESALIHKNQSPLPRRNAGKHGRGVVSSPPLDLLPLCCRLCYRALIIKTRQERWPHPHPRRWS